MATASRARRSPARASVELFMGPISGDPGRSSLRLDAAQLDDGFVARRFGPEESGGRGGSEPYGNMAQLADTLAYGHVGQGRAELGGEALDDARIRAVRRREHPPVAAHPLRKSGFDGRRDTGQLGH